MEEYQNLRYATKGRAEKNGTQVAKSQEKALQTNYFLTFYRIVKGLNGQLKHNLAVAFTIEEY